MKRKKKIKKKKEEKFRKLVEEVKERIPVDEKYTIIIRTRTGKWRKKQTLITINGPNDRKLKRLVARICSMELRVFNSFREKEILLSGDKKEEVKKIITDLGFNESFIKIL